MGEVLPVQVGDTLVYAQVSDSGGLQTVGLDDVLSFDGVRAALEAVASELGQVWDRVRPSEATVELGVNLTAKAGKLTALIVEGGGEASLKVTLKWAHPSAGSQVPAPEGAG